MAVGLASLSQRLSRYRLQDPFGPRGRRRAKVAYDDECAGQSRGIATFTGQIIVGNKGTKFLAGGDSGSLMVEDTSDSPRAVGLLFAGSNRIGVANPIDEVLDAFGVAMVGGSLAGAGVSSTEDDAVLGAAAAAQKRLAGVFEAAPHAVGHAIGHNASGAVVLKVLVEKDAAAARAVLPSRAGGFPIVVQEVGRIVAF